MPQRISDIKCLAQRAHSDRVFCNQLFHTMFSSCGHEAYCAAWALTHLPDSDNQLIDEHRDELIYMSITTTNSSMRRLSLSLLERLTWNKQDVHIALLDFCLEHMTLLTEPYGARALCIKIAYKMCVHYPELKTELQQCLLLMEPTELGAGVAHTRNKILSQL